MLPEVLAKYIDKRLEHSVELGGPVERPSGYVLV